MKLLPIQTRRFEPPQDDLFAILDEALQDVQEKDVVLISSKVVAIGEGRCAPKEGTDKVALVEQEADFLIPRSYWKSPLTVIYNAFIGTSGIDESNAGEYLVLLPEDAFASAQEIHAYLKKRFGLSEVGVVITDSRSEPMRYGAMGVGIAFWGIEPLEDCIGKEDLFGRPMQIEKSNIIDGLAAAATLVMGEVAECQPVVVARDVPRLVFAEGNLRDELFVPYEDDTFRVLYEDKRQ